MGQNQLLAVLPLIILAVAAVLTMLLIAWRRDQRMMLVATLGGLLAALSTLPVAWGLAPVAVTPLLIIDHFALFFQGLLLGAGIVMALLSYCHFCLRPGQNEELYVLLLTALLGSAVLVASRQFAVFFIGLELMSISLLTMIAYPLNEVRPLEAGFKYLVLSGVSSAFLLFGMALIYTATGSFALQSGAALSTQPLVLIGLMMLFGGLGFKLSLVPFHLWTADVYQGAPTPVSGFIATVSKAAVFAFLLRYVLVVEGWGHPAVLMAVGVIAAASIVMGNLLALRQNSVKRILGYSSIAHFGYLLVALLALGQGQAALPFEAAVFYLTAYMITTFGAFAALTVFSSNGTESDGLDDFEGLFWQQPLSACAFSLMLFSLAGMPLTAVFVGKFYLFTVAVDRALWWLLWVLIVGSAIGLYYYLRIILRMSQTPTGTERIATLGGAGFAGGRVVLYLLAATVIWLGVSPSFWLELIQSLGPAGLE